MLEGLIKDTEKKGIVPAKCIPVLQKIREFALKENDPLVTRSLRLAWQHLESKEAFEVAFLEEAESQDENFIYLLSLCLKSDNTYNRDELREMTNLMQETA